MIDSFHSSGNTSLFQIDIISLWIALQIVLTPALINSAWIWSIPGDLWFFSFPSSKGGLWGVLLKGSIQDGVRLSTSWSRYFVRKEYKMKRMLWPWWVIGLGLCKAGDFAEIIRIVRLVVRKSTLYDNIKEEMYFARPVLNLVDTVPLWRLLNDIRKYVQAPWGASRPSLHP